MFATINGTELYYEVHGSGPPLMLIHGGPGLSDHKSNKTTHAALADQFTLIMFDLRGCGQSGRPPAETYTHENFARDVEGLRQHLGLDRMAVLGRSYGGFIAQEYALRFGENLRRLVLADTAAWNGYEGIAKEAALKANLPGVTPDLIERLFAGQMRDDDELREVFVAIQPLYFDHQDIEAVKERARGLTYAYETHNACFSRCLAQFDLRGRLREIRVPTLVLCGRHDWITPLAASEEIAAGIPAARLVVFEHSGHAPQVDESELYLKTVREFLSETTDG